MQDPLFFIALLPDMALQREVTAFKNHCAEHFEASHALTSPPHITLVSPFPWPMSDLSKLGGALKDFADLQSPFEVDMNGFGSFPPRVVFVDVVPNDALSRLATNLADHLKNTVGLHRKTAHGFNPHMTIAHRDLKPERFEEAWAYFSEKDFQRSFEADALTLLRHEQRRWQVEEVFYFLGLSHGATKN